MSFTQAENDYIGSQPLARVATTGPDGQPDVVPVVFEFDGTHFWVGGLNPTHTHRTRNIQAGNNRVALVIDDLAPGERWKPRFLRLRHHRARRTTRRLGHSDHEDHPDPVLVREPRPTVDG